MHGRKGIRMTRLTDRGRIVVSVVVTVPLAVALWASPWNMWNDTPIMQFDTATCDSSIVTDIGSDGLWG